MEKLAKIQQELKAPKGQYNNFGKYKYRSCEDIVEAVKPLLKKENCLLLLSDELVNVGERYYIQATAKFINIESKNEIEVYGYAREEENKKGMDGSQITGSSSSYARKYALNGLFAIDDGVDSDKTNNSDNEKNYPKKTKPQFTSERLAKMKERAKDKKKEEILKNIEKIKKDYIVSDIMAEELNLFVKNLK